MLNDISVTNRLGDTLTMELRNPGKSGFLIQNITGLNPVKATVNSTELSTNDGSVFNSARLESRNIVITVIFYGTDSIESQRHLLYQYFSTKQKVRLEFNTDLRTCYIYGVVESVETTMFTSMAGAQISVICPNPYFYSLENNITKFNSVDAGFEFPFSNESLVEPMIEFGLISREVNKTVYYPGDAEVGMVIKVHMTGAVSGLSIFNTETKEAMKINSKRLAALTGSDLKAGDDLIISTIRGDKYVRLLRAGKTHNVLNALDKNPGWFMLKHGDNLFAYTADSGAANLGFTIENPLLYEGL